MRLRSKFFLITACVTVVPIAATTIGRGVVERRSRAEFELLLAEAEQRVRAQYTALKQEVASAVGRLADPEDHFIGPILIALAKGGQDDEIFRQLPLVAPRVMRERGLDVLMVVGPGRRILASGHFPGRIGDTVAKSRRGGRAKGTTLVAERVMSAEGRPVTRLAVEAWRTARSQLGTRLRVMGGRYLSGLERRLRLRGGAEIMIADGAGRSLSAPPSGWKRYSRYPRRSISLSDADGRAAATITVAVSDERLRTTLRVIDYVAYALVLGALFLALVLGAAARRITSPLEQLAEGAEAVAAGDLERQIPVRTRDEVGELVAAFNRMTAELKESKERLVTAERMAAWREIARRIAHEIKNPLSPIQTSIETLRKVHRKGHVDFEEIFEESTSTILEEVERMKRIVSEFSNFARMPKPSLDPFEVGDWIRSTVGLYGSTPPVVECELKTADSTLVGDREQLTQVLVNLLENAKDALDGVDQPRLRISARERDGQLEIAVEDNGRGFNEQTAAELFTPYFTTKGAGGTGLGLAICHRIVSDHGGTIDARGEPGAGAVFSVRLPLAGPASADN